MDKNVELQKIKRLLEKGKYITANTHCDIQIAKCDKDKLDFMYLKAQALEGMNEFRDSLEILSDLISKGKSLIPAYTRVKFKQQSVESVSEEERYILYKKWLDSRNIKYNKTEVKSIRANYRGVFAIDNISKNDVVLFVPIDSIITLKMAKESSVGERLIKNNVKFIYPNNTFLSTFVLCEIVNPLSNWLPFIRMLPRNVDNFPIFFSADEKKSLKGSHFLNLIKELKNAMKYDYNSICKAIPIFPDIATFRDFMKMRALLNSRIFYIKVGEQDMEAIIPYGDMFNYKPQSNMSFWNYYESEKGFQVIASTNIKKGDEIFVYYGYKPNSAYFLFYGFVVENNPKDEVSIEIHFDSNDPLKTAKVMYLDVVRDGPEILKLRKKVNNRKYFNVLSYLRYVVYDDSKDSLREIKEECEKEQEKEGGEISFRALNIPVLNLANEIKALTRLKQICQKNLLQYPQDSEDEKLMNTQLPSNERNCLILRIGEKEVLKFHISVCDVVREILNKKSKKELSEELVKAKEKYFLADSYLESIKKLL